MARDIARDGKDLYRAVITTTTTREGQEPFVDTYTRGPYNLASTAQALITREKKDAERLTRRFGRDSANHADGLSWTEKTATGYVEKAETVWRRVS